MIGRREVVDFSGCSPVLILDMHPEQLGRGLKRKYETCNMK